MTSEIPQPHHREHENPLVDRFMRSVARATESGRVIGDVKYKFHRVGGLLVATLHRIYSPIYSVYAQDKKSGQPLIMGIEYDRNLDTVKRGVPQVSINLNPYEVPIEDRVVHDLEERAVCAGYLMHSDKKDEEEPVHKEDDFLSKLLNQLDDPTTDDDFMEGFWESANFIGGMRAEGLADAKPENLGKVSEALEIVSENGIWRMKKRLTRAEELFREGLGLTD